jgi:ketosteroid isomerase-like protein
MIHRQEIEAWLSMWQRFIQETAYEAARPLFADGVVAFGTVTGYMHGLADLESRQWRQVWHRIKDFAFETESLTVFGEPSSDIVTIACLWRSLGQAPEGWYKRRGRVSLVLRKTDNGLQCIHSHFSMEPGIPAVAGAAEM